MMVQKLLQAMLLDHGLPGAEGCIVLERLKSIMLLSTISVIVVTAQDPDVAE